LNGNDEIAFAAYVYLPTGPAYGLFVFSGGKLLRLLGSGDPAPGGGDFVRLWYTSFNDAGAVAFSASTSSTGPWGIYLWSQGNVRAIAQSGDPAPGGGTLDFPGNRTFITSLNGLSEVAFEANLSTSNRGVFFYSEGAVSSIARPGDPTPEGETITSADSPSLNDAGQVAFRARISSGFGTYLFSDGTVSRVAAPGDPAPGGGTFTYVAPSGLNASGQVACTGGVPAYGAFLATPVR